MVKISTVFLLYKQSLVRQGWFGSVQKPGPVQIIQKFKEQNMQDSSSEMVAPTLFRNDSIYVMFYKRKVRILGQFSKSGRDGGKFE